MAEWPEVADWRTRITARRLSDRRAAERDAGRRVVRAAIELVEAGGPDFSVQEVADRAGVSRRKFYELFPAKDDLILALLTDIGDVQLERRRARVDVAGTTSLQRLRRALELAMDPADSNDPILRATAELSMRLAPRRADDLRAVMRPWVEYTAALLAACRAEGLVRSSTADLMIASFIESAVNERLLRDRVRPDPDDPPPDVFVELLLHGALGAPGSGQR
ncbi:MAG: TetR/AcrR family transcriptional regulator [Desertimonas sp.]